MWRLLFSFLLLSIGVEQMPAQTNAPATPKMTATAAPLIYVIPIRDEIEPSLAYLVRRGVKEAMEAKATALVLHMETPGGRGDAMQDIMKAVARFEPKGQTYTLVDKEAFSAGAFITACTRHIYMTPGSTIGAAAPVTMSQAGVQELGPKFVSAYASIIRAAAEQNGHNPLVFDAMVNKQKGLVVEGKEIVAKGDILTLTNTEAEKKYGTPAKPLLSLGTVPNLDALIGKISETPGAKLITLQPTGFERLARWITMLAPFLMTAAMILGYIEFQKPGFGLAGGLAILCFLVVFFGHYVAGLSGFEPLLIFLIGAILIAVEIVLFPGLILPALTGAVLLLAALLLTQIDRYPGDALLPTSVQLQMPLQNLAFSLALTFIAAILIARYFPKKLFYAKLVAATVPGSSLRFPEIVKVGAEGIASTTLRPSGSARIGDQPVDVITDGRLIESGTRIRIIAIEGTRIVVEPILAS